MANEKDLQAVPAEKPDVMKEFVAPIVKMVIICIVTSFLLALTNSFTLTRIEANAAAETNAAMQELLPEADSFTEVPITADVTNATALYEADNGAGYVVECYGQGYGGRVPAMVAFGPDGTIAGVKFLGNSETPGVGTNVTSSEDFAAQFSGEAPVQRGISDIDAVAGATITSKAALTAINAASAVYEEQVQGHSVDTTAGSTETAEEGGAA